MKRSFCLLLLIALLYGCTGGSTRPLIKKSPYDADFRYYSERLEGKKRKTAHIKKMEKAYQLAQKTDLVAADSLLNLDKPDRWLYVHAYYRRMQERQQKVLSLMPLESKEGYKPDLLIVGNLSERELASRKASAGYLYGQSEDLLALGTRAGARAAYRTLGNLTQNYFPVWEQSAALLDSAARVGVEHILVDSDRPFSPAYLDSRWQKFYRDPYARSGFDVVIRTHGLAVYVGPDMESTSTYTESKQIEVGYEEKKDSAGNVIERTPIYETISATVTETIVTKTADADLWVEVLDGQTGAMLRSESLSAQHVFSESRIYVSGDTRALSRCVNASVFSIFTPSYWDMERQVLDKIDTEFSWYLRSRLWTD